MTIPVQQQIAVFRYLLSQKLRGRSRYPLVLMLEPLFQCNLHCVGCGKITHPEEVLKKRLSLQECLSAAEECGAPVVSIAGGEPLLHHSLPEIVRALIERGKFVYLCTNGLLLKKRMEDYNPSPYLTFSVHLDGSRGRHDYVAGMEGLYDCAVDAIETASKRGFRVTVNCTLYDGITADEALQFFRFVDRLGVEGITVAPAFHHEKAQHRGIFMDRSSSKGLFREIIRGFNGHRPRFNHTRLYLDFLAGNRSYQCTPWGNPTRSVLGWQRPCYLLCDGFAPTFRSLMEETEWDRYGLGRNPRCAQCMLHSGFEPTAVEDLWNHPFSALKLLLSGHRTEGPMAPEIPVSYPRPATHEGPPPK